MPPTRGRGLASARRFGAAPWARRVVPSGGPGRRCRTPASPAIEERGPGRSPGSEGAGWGTARRRRPGAPVGAVRRKVPGVGRSPGGVVRRGRDNGRCRTSLLTEEPRDPIRDRPRPREGQRSARGRRPAPRRLPRPGQRLPRRRAPRRGHRHPGRHAPHHRRGADAHHVPADHTNLAARAAIALAERHGIAPDVHLHITKDIPVAGGMAGGSADAAGALVACDALWGTSACRARNCWRSAADLGSDVPFSLVGGAAARHRRGAKLLTRWRSAGTFHWVFALADGGLSTPAVYAECDRLREATGAGARPRAAEPLLDALARGGPRRARRRGPQRPAARRPVAAPGARRHPGRRPRRGPRLAGLRLRAHLRFLAREARGRPARDRWRAALARVRHRPGTVRYGRPGAGGRGAVVTGAVRPGRGPARGRSARGRRLPWERRSPPVRSGMAVNLVNLEAVGKVYGTRALLDGVSLGVNEGDRIGVVGRNGDGKTTLIRMLAKLDHADNGRVTHYGGLRVGVLTQHDSLDPAATIRHEVIGDLADHEWAGNAKIRDILTGLFGELDLPGFPQGLDTVIGPLSGGERRRIALAKLLIAEQDLIVLDEPTNHLDVEGIAWLAGHLRARRSALVSSPTTAGSSTRSAPGCGTSSAARPRVRGRLLRLRLRAGRARADRRHRGGQAAEPDAQGAGLAAARRPRPHVASPLPHRGRQRADRRRPAAARQRRADEVRHLRLGKTVFDLEDVTVHAGPEGAAQARDLAARPRRPDRPGRRERRRARPRCCGPWPRPRTQGEAQPARGQGRRRQDRQARVPLAGGRRTRPRRCGCWRPSRRSASASTSARAAR